MRLDFRLTWRMATIEDNDTAGRTVVVRLKQWATRAGAMAINTSTGDNMSAGDNCDGHRRMLACRPGRGRTVALVDLRQGPVARDGTSRGAAIVFDLALREIEQAVRNEDRVCPFGTSRVAVAFGPDADTVSPTTLGQRLARAVRRSLVLGERA